MTQNICQPLHNITPTGNAYRSAAHAYREREISNPFSDRWPEVRGDKIPTCSEINPQ